MLMLSTLSFPQHQGIDPPDIDQCFNDASQSIADLSRAAMEKLEERGKKDLLCCPYRVLFSGHCMILYYFRVSCWKLLKKPSMYSSG